MQKTNDFGTSALPVKGWGSLRRAIEAFRKRKLFVIAAFVIIFQCLVAWIVAFAAYRVALLLV